MIVSLRLAVRWRFGQALAGGPCSRARSPWPEYPHGPGRRQGRRVTSARQQAFLLGGELAVGEHSLVMELAQLLEPLDRVRADPAAACRGCGRLLAFERVQALVLLGLLLLPLRVALSHDVCTTAHGRGAEEGTTSHEHVRSPTRLRRAVPARAPP